MKTQELPVDSATIGSEYAHTDEHRKRRVGTITDIRFAGRRDRTRVIFSVKFPGEKRDKEFRHEMVGTYEAPGIAAQENETADLVALIHTAAVTRAMKLYGAEKVA